MLPPLLPLSETHHIGPTCREWVLLPERSPALRRARFAWVGHSVVRSPYRIVRLKSRYAHALAAVSGEGRVVIDGRVVRWRPGQVLLAPQGEDHAFEVAGAGPWRIAWAFWDDLAGERLLAGTATRLIKAEATDFVATVELVAREGLGEAEPAAMQALVTLLQTHLRRIIGATPKDARLVKLWEEVEADLAHAWTAAELARRAATSEEHLRRLCHRHYRCSPMSYVSQRRMHRAAVLLRASGAKVETIAEQVGFASVYAFSAAFKRWSGLPPARFRQGGAERGA